MPILLITLIWIDVAALALAAYLYLRERTRRDVLEAIGSGDRITTSRVIRPPVEKPLGAFGEKLLKRAPSVWTNNASIRERLVHAGYDGQHAPAMFAIIRVGVLILLPLLALLFGPHDSFLKTVVVIGAAAATGLMLPPAYLYRAVAARQDKIRRSLPDALDLLVVCVEAGISLDAAILRVAKDMVFVHPELSREMVIVNRKTNAGLTREAALRGMWDRTGVEEIRTLVSSLIQSERWGTSSSRVLRITSETLRRKRRFRAEKKAATAPIKMLIPMALLIFPALFVVILGPAVMKIVGVFAGQ
jgi:tight adherence protein C